MENLPGLTGDRRRLIEEHLPRVPLPTQATTLLTRWAEGPGLPVAPRELLHLLYLAGTSEALTLSLLRRPRDLRALSRDCASAGILGPSGLEEALGRFILAARDPSPEARFAAFRMLQTARIILGEVLGSLSLEQVTGELSALADAILRRAFAETYQPLRERLGVPLRRGGDGRPAPCGLAVFALGKLGGNELNYSSDVDLVFFYEEEGATDRGEENHRFFSAWVREACALLTRPTPDGPALRVDPNLRPRGRDGEFTLSFSAAVAYYRDWAEQWERQAWMRARPCAADLAAGGRFLARMEEVLFKPYAFSGIAYQNREARRKTLSRLRASRGEDARRDIKEGPGGIRDVEFAVQALQLAHGQTDRWVRGPNTPQALARLSQKGHLTEPERAALARAYTILRRAEHWSQVQGMRQAHDLPEDDEGWTGLARYVGAEDPGALRATLKTLRAETTRLFDRICARLERASSEEDAAEGLLGPEGLRAALEGAGVQEPHRAGALLGELYRALEPYLTTPRRRNHFLRIHYSLQRELAGRPGTHAGLLALHRLLPTLQENPSLLTLALDHPRLPRLVFWLAARSEVLLERMQQWPELLKKLTYRDLQSIEGDLSPFFPPADPDTMRRAQKEVFFLTGARALLMGEEPVWVQWRLTDVAGFLLGNVFARACEETESVSGLSRGLLSHSVCLLALGRMGTREMLPRSDLDLVPVKVGPWILPDDPERSAAVETALVRRLLDGLTAVTRHGALYPVDLRLKPYGTAGPLLVPADSLGAYFLNRADSWERVAWLKARPVAGDSSLGAGAVRDARAAIFSRGLDGADLQRLEDLRGRLAESDGTLEGMVKFSRGGLMTADLLLLAAQARARLDAGPLPRPELLRRLVDAGAIPDEGSPEIAAAVRFQEALLVRLRLKFLRAPDRRRAAEVLAVFDEEGTAGLLGGGFGPVPPGGFPLAEHWEHHRAVLREAWDRFRDTDEPFC